MDFKIPAKMSLKFFGIELNEMRFKNVVYLYELAVKHIDRLDHLKLEDIEENIEVVIEFAQKV